jgi:predicted DNA-binding transcriptional regulator AlpA
MTVSNDPLLTARQSAEAASISLAAFWRSVATGRLPPPQYVLPRAPRWRLSELHTAIEAHRMLPMAAKEARRRLKT